MKKTWILVGFMGMLTTTQAMEPEEIDLNRAYQTTSWPEEPVVFDNRTVNLDQNADLGYGYTFRGCVMAGRVFGERAGSKLLDIMEGFRQDDRKKALGLFTKIRELINRDKESSIAYTQAREENWRGYTRSLNEQITQLQARATTAEQTLAGTSEALVRIHGDREQILEALRNASATGLTGEQIQALLRQHQ